MTGKLTTTAVRHGCSPGTPWNLAWESQGDQRTSAPHSQLHNANPEKFCWGDIPFFALSLLGPGFFWGGGADNVTETQILSPLLCFTFSLTHIKNQTKPFLSCLSMRMALGTCVAS